MTTAFASIVTAITDALATAPAVCDTMYRARPTEVPAQVNQAVNVQWERAMPSEGAILGAPIDWESVVTIEAFARSTTESGDLAVDPLLLAIFERLGSDTTLGGAVEHLRIAGIETENTSENKRTGWVRLTYTAVHRTTNATLN